jgi:hypothetical protein
MAAITTTPIAVAYRDESFLAAGITAAATTVTVAALYKDIAGVKTKQGLDSTGGYAEIALGGKYEVISFGAASVNATTKVTTLTDVRRGITQVSTTASFAAGTGRTWPKGAAFRVIDFSNYIHNTVFTDTNQTITGNKTFSGAIVTSGSVQVPVYADATARDAAITVPANGMLVYLTDQGTLFQYIGGAWAANATGTTSNGSTTVAGKYEEGTVAEQAAHTATGGTGARIVPAIANLVTLAADGTWVSGAIPTINTAKFIDGSIGGTGVASPVLGALLIGGGAGLAMTPIGPGTAGQVPLSNGTTLAMGFPGSKTRWVLLLRIILLLALGSAKRLLTRRLRNMPLPHGSSQMTGMAVHWQ